MSTLDAASDGNWQHWVGRSEQRTDTFTVAAAAALAATLDHDEPELQPGAELPPLAHWLLFHPRARQSALNADGHPLHGGLLPPVPLPRRMWAGSRIEFQEPLRVGEPLTRVSRIASIESKRGRNGALVFITLQHTIRNAHGLVLSEAQDIVFREAQSAGAAPAVPIQPAPAAEFERTLVPDPVLLFRYSALTFNAHRIHYDRPYATNVEGYPSLVVHGPLTATLLLDLLRREQPHARLHRFSFRALRPLFADQHFAVCGRNDGAHCVALWTRGPDGAMTMDGRAELIAGP